jgi:hypothetical protein
VSTIDSPHGLNRVDRPATTEAATTTATSAGVSTGPSCPGT